MKRSTRLNRKARLRSKTTLRRVTALHRARPNREWRKVRTWCQHRADGWCEARIEGVCTGRGEHAHHILPRSAGGQDDLSNLMWCCGFCHGHLHLNPEWARSQGFLKSRWSA